MIGEGCSSEAAAIRCQEHNRDQLSGCCAGVKKILDTDYGYGDVSARNGHACPDLLDINLFIRVLEDGVQSRSDGGIIMKKQSMGKQRRVLPPVDSGEKIPDPKPLNRHIAEYRLWQIFNVHPLKAVRSDSEIDHVGRISEATMNYAMPIEYLRERARSHQTNRSYHCRVRPLIVRPFAEA